MKRYISKAMVLLMAGALAIGCVACNTTKTEEAPVEATTEAVQKADTIDIETVAPEDFMQKVGFDLPVPEGAEDVDCSIIHMDDGDIAEITFRLDGKNFCLRAKKTMVCEIDANKEGEEGGDLCRINATWKSVTPTSVKDRNGLVHIAEAAEGIERPGYISWIDIVPGVMYNLSMENVESASEIMTYADEFFVPYDGETEADDANSEGEAYYSDTMALIQQIYDTKAGTAGSEERVQAAADSFIDYINNHEEEMTIEFACDEVEEGLKAAQGDTDPDTFKANFQECFDAVKEAVVAKDESMKDKETFKCIDRAVELKFEEM